MNLNHAEIIAVLGGPVAIATRLSIKSPSVYGWMGEGKFIPDSRLIELAADIEATGLYTRKQIRPNDWQAIWPELVGLQAVDAGALVPGDALGYVGEGVAHG